MAEMVCGGDLVSVAELLAAAAAAASVSTSAGV
jgi:hypothetical protein